MLPYCRVIHKSGDSTDLPIEMYDVIVDAIANHIIYKDDQLVSSTLIGGTDRISFKISSVEGLCERTIEGLQGSWEEQKAFEEQKKLIMGWEE